MKENLLDIIDQSFSGVIWITEQAPSIEDKFYQDLDYILNGLFQMQDSLSEKEINLFFTNSFGENFFVIHALNNNNLNEKLGSALENFSSQINDESKILYINDGNVYPKKAFSKIGKVEIVRL